MCIQANPYHLLLELEKIKKVKCLSVRMFRLREILEER